MTEYRNCKQCGASFEAKRTDHFFCCAAHVAAFYRDNPNPEYIHAKRNHIHSHYCEQCGVPFAVNDYAQRGGKRAPKYCSPKCKQAAYRARQKGEPQPQAERRYSEKGTDGSTAHSNGDKSQGNARSRQNANQTNSQSNSSKTKSAREFWQGYPNKYEAALDILGVKSVDTKTVRAAWIKLLNRFHPDRNNAQDATIMTQKINWAYEYLTK